MPTTIARAGFARPPLVPLFLRVLAAGLLAGVLDLGATTLLDVVILRDTTATELLQSIASGLLGAAAYSGGRATAALGTALHFLIATVWAALFALVAGAWPALRKLQARRQILLVGLAFGAFVWLFMDFVVLNWSRADAAPPSDWSFWAQLAIHMLCVGTPIAAVMLRAP